MNESADSPLPSPAAGDGGAFLIRWRGQTSGPYSRAELDRKLGRREIGLLHEVQCDGRWVPLRTLLARTSGPKLDQLPSPAGKQFAPELPLVDESSRVQPDERFELRWKGAVAGPFSVGEIERKLDHQDIGMLHEISVSGQWITLSDFFLQRNLTLAAARSTAAPDRQGCHTWHKAGGKVGIGAGDAAT